MSVSDFGNVLANSAAIEYSSEESVPIQDPDIYANRTVIKKENPIADLAGSIGASIAQQAANQRARQAGYESGQNPSSRILPSIGESDAEFAKVKQQTQYANASANANKFLSQMAQTAKRAPTDKSLSDFSQNAKKSIGELLDAQTPETRMILERDVEASYQSNLSDISKAVQHRNDQILAQNREMYINESVNSINQLCATGNSQAAINKAANVRGWISSLYERGEYTPAQAAAYQKMMAEVERNAIASSVFNQALKDGSGNAEAMLKSAEHDPEINNVLLEQYHQNQALTNADDNIVENEILTKANTGQLSPADLPEAATKISSPEAYAKLERKVSSIQNGNKIDYQTFSNILLRPGDIENLQTLSPQKKNQFLEFYSARDTDVKNATHGLSIQNDLYNKVRVATQFKTNFPNIVAQLGSTIMNGSPENSVKAMNSYLQNSPNNNVTFIGMNKEAISRAEDFQVYKQGGMDDADAYLKIIGSRENVTPKELEARKERFDMMAKSGGQWDLSNFERIQSFAAQSLDAGKTAPIGLGYVFKKTLESNSKLCATPEAALKMTKNEINTVWGKTYVNGKEEFTYCPVEKFVCPDVPDGAKMVRNQAINQLHLMSSMSIDIFNKHPEQPFYYDIEEVETNKKSSIGTHPQNVRYTEPREPKIMKVYRDGSVISGKLVIQSHENTLSQNTERASYYMAMNIDDVNYPITNPENLSMPLEYMPVYSQLSEDYKEYEGMSNADRLKAISNRNELRKLQYRENKGYPNYLEHLND